MDFKKSSIENIKSRIIEIDQERQREQRKSAEIAEDYSEIYEGGEEYEHISKEYQMIDFIKSEQPMIMEGKKIFFEDFNVSRTNNAWISKCDNCDEIAIWAGDAMVYPQYQGIAPPPNPDMPRSVKDLYDEANAICEASPRGAAALLRCAMEQICKDLYDELENTENIDSDAATTRIYPPLAKMIKELSRKYNFHQDITDMLEGIKGIGNEAVHSGAYIDDSGEIAKNLFLSLNHITDEAISRKITAKNLKRFHNSLSNNQQKNAKGSGNGKRRG